MLNDSYFINNAMTNTARVNNTDNIVKNQLKKLFECFVFAETKCIMFPNIITSVNIWQFHGPIPKKTMFCEQISYNAIVVCLFNKFQ